MSSVVTLYGIRELPEHAPRSMTVEWLDKKQNIGIEIEVERDEGADISSSGLNLWTVKQDGSLRRGEEFVLSRPLRGDMLTEAIEEFFHHNTTVRSPTSGTHIHLDMRDKESTYDVMKTMAAIMACIEPAVFGMFAEGREWCGYTNTLTSMPHAGRVRLFSEQTEPSDFAIMFNAHTREYKYYGFNVLPLGRYGSVEFRYFPTAVAAEELVEWVQFCMAIKKAAVSIGSLPAFKYYLSSEMCWEEFLNRFFQEWRDRMVPFLPYKEVSARYKMLRRGEAPASTKLTSTPLSDNAPTHQWRDTRFKKFFAIKMDDPDSGRKKLVYDNEGVATYTPLCVYHRYDPKVNQYNATFENNSILLADGEVYYWSKTRGHWMTWFYYDSLRITGYSGHPPFSIEKVKTVVRKRLAGEINGVGYLAIPAESTNGRTAVRDLTRLLELLDTIRTDEQSPEQEEVAFGPEDAADHHDED